MLKEMPQTPKIDLKKEYKKFGGRQINITPQASMHFTPIETPSHKTTSQEIIEEVARRTNANLDKVQAKYNKRFNFPPPELS